MDNLSQYQTPLLVALGFLQLVDAGTTVAILKKGGKEMNPLLDKFMKKIGAVPALVVVKAAILAFLYFIGPAVSPQILVIALLGYVAVIGNNLYQLKKFKSKK